jgi:Putative lumazine-binding
VLDKTAAAKIVAFWGIDYMQLAKYDGQWKIVNILWQAHPPGKDAAPSASRE